MRRRYENGDAYGEGWSAGYHCTGVTYPYAGPLAALWPLALCNGGTDDEYSVQVARLYVVFSHRAVYEDYLSDWK